MLISSVVPSYPVLSDYAKLEQITEFTSYGTNKLSNLSSDLLPDYL